MVGTNNAVNLTDGLDGLAAGCGAIVTVVLGVVAYCVGRRALSADLGQIFVPGADEIAVFLASLGGGVVGFLWWNCKPAKVFMGNTGALALGGALGIAAVVVRQEILLLVAGFAFVWEAVSVMIQVGSYKWRGGKRVFLCAPFHHHLQFLGWPESRVVMSFWIGTVVLSVVALGLQRVL
jgi:phospho-N-acetylmuramoyl-pentapeptide-transferase